jgi:hypothetical protein
MIDITDIDLSDDELEALSNEERAELAERLDKMHWAKGKHSFAAYCKMLDVPGTPIKEEEDGEFYVDRLAQSRHHMLIVDAVQKMADGEYHDVDGIMAFMPPGAAKSTYLSVLGSSWLLGRKKGTNVILASYGQELADRNSRRVRQITQDPTYMKIMGCCLQSGHANVAYWATSNASECRAAGMNAGITGFRADFALIDDPIKGREDADSETIRAKVWDTYIDDIDSRLKPGGKIFICMTRWHEDDLAGRILGEAWKGQSGFWRGTDGKNWLILNLPLMAEHKDDPLGRAKGELLWPEWFKLEDAKRRQEAAKKGGTFARSWASLYQQRPAPNEGAILAKSYWRPWTKTELPDVERVFLTYDTAFEEDEENDYSAMTAWGVFKHISKKTQWQGDVRVPTGEEYSHHHVIMLGGWQERVNAVDLIRHVQEHAKLFRPDRILVEKRASGIQLIQELQRRRLPVKPWLPRGKPGSKGKVPRAHAIATILEQGSVWYVPGERTEKVLEQCAAFPFGVNDDSVDTVTMALAYFRDKWIFRTADDELSEEELKDVMIERAEHKKATKRSLYGGQLDGKHEKHDLDLDDIERMTPQTRRKLYGGEW